MGPMEPGRHIKNGSKRPIINTIGATLILLVLKITEHHPLHDGDHHGTNARVLETDHQGVMPPG